MKTHLVNGFALFAILSASFHAAQAAAPIVPPGAPAPTDDKEIALAPKWMPDRRMVTQQMLKATEFYARAVLGGAEAGKETVPTKVLSGNGWDLDWFMALAEAEKKLPPGTRAQMGGATILKNSCWPQGSIYVKGYQGKFLVPRPVADPAPPEIFTDLHLICDMKQRLISAQFNTDQRRWLYWEKMVMGKPVKVEKLNPYFDFLTMGANADAGRMIEYQVLRPLPGMAGMACVHTVLPRGRSIGSPLGNVRWYLSEPLARKLLEIAEKNQ